MHKNWQQFKKGTHSQPDEHIESNIGFRSLPDGKRIMPETRFTEFLALFVEPRVGICRSASETVI